MVGAMAAVLAVVSNGRAGNPGSFEFDVFANPEFLTVTNEGVVLVRYRPPAGGSSTHVVFTIKVPTALAPVASSGCAFASEAGGLKTFTCNIGTVNGGQVVKRYLLITAPAGPAGYTIEATFTADRGATGKKGGGGFETDTQTDPLTVVSSGNTSRAGTCTGLASTPSATADDLVSTSISDGVRLDSGVPCPWGFVGEEDGPSGDSKTDISFFGFPQTTADDPVKWVITFYTLPAPFHTLDVFFDPNYTAGDTFANNLEPLESCVDAPAPPAAACLEDLVKDGRGAIATIIAQGTDGDPGAGMG